jgi:hypothetical protein
MIPTRAGRSRAEVWGARADNVIGSRNRNQKGRQTFEPRAEFFWEMVPRKGRASLATPEVRPQSRRARPESRTRRS